MGKFHEGIIKLDVTDTRTDKLVWRSDVKGILRKNTDKVEAGLAAAIEEILGIAMKSH